MSIFGAADMNTELTFDAMKVFHKYKKVNPETGRQNPTVVNGSWGYFAGFISGTTVDYSFKGTTGSFTGYASNSTGVQAMAYGLDSPIDSFLHHLEVLPLLVMKWLNLVLSM